MTDLLPADGVTEKELLQIAYALEQKSEHPLAHAIVQRAQEEGTVEMVSVDVYKRQGVHSMAEILSDFQCIFHFII